MGRSGGERREQRREAGTGRDERDRQPAHTRGRRFAGGDGLRNVSRHREQGSTGR
jgi:hypothetical protein